MSDSRVQVRPSMVVRLKLALARCDLSDWTSRPSPSTSR